MATRISDARTPFRDINGRQSEKRRSRSILQKENITVSMPDLSCANLDALIYQKAMDLVAVEKQNFDRSLQLKSACIQELQEMMLATTNEKNARITELQEILLSSTSSAHEMQQQQQIDYKREYERVLEQLRQMEEQLLTYTGLQDELKTTRELQLQVQQRLRETHSKVLRDAAIITERAQILDSQAQGILERQKLDQLMEKMMSENFRLRQVIRETELKLATTCYGASEVSPSELEKREEEIVLLKSRLADVEQQLITANDATEERNARIEILLANQRESEETVASQREKIAKLEEELATIQLTVSNVQQEMAALSAERDALSVTLVNQQAAAQQQIDDLKEQLCTVQSNQEFAELDLEATREELDNKKQQLIRSLEAQEDVEHILTDFRSRYAALERCLERERQEIKIITSDFNNASVGVGQLVEKIKLWQLELEDMRTRAEESDDSDNTPLATSLNLSGVTELPISDTDFVAVEPLSISSEASNADSDDDDENVADAGDVTCNADANSRAGKSIVARVLLGMKAVSQKQKKVANAKTNAATREMKEAVTSIAWQQLNQILKDTDSRLDALRQSEASFLKAFNVQRKKLETHIGQLEEEVKALTASAAESVACEKQLLDELARKDEHQHHLQDMIAALRKNIADSVHALALKERDCESLQKMRVEKHELERRLETNASDLAAMTRRVQVLEGEMRVMEEEMAALLAGESLDARMQRQAIDDRTKLRKKNYQLEYDLLVCQQALDDVKLKASERLYLCQLDVLDLNWKRAEKEVQRLDEQLMDVSRVLLPYKDTVLAVCPQLVPLLSWPADDVCLVSSKHIYAPATADHFAVPASVSSLAANSIPSLQTPSKMGAPSTTLGYGLTPIRSLRVTPMKGGTTPSRWAASAAAPFSDLQDIDWIISKLDEMVESEKHD